MSVKCTKAVFPLLYGFHTELLKQGKAKWVSDPVMLGLISSQV